MYISLFWIGVMTTIMVEIGLVFLVAGIGYFKDGQEDNNNA